MENGYFIKRFYLNKADFYVLRMKLKDWKQSEKNHTDKNKEKKGYFM